MNSSENANLPIGMERRRFILSDNAITFILLDDPID
jgi:hypothetical protein